VATKRKRRTRKSAARKNPPTKRRRRRSYRRNPKISVTNIFGRLTDGVVNAGVAVGGKVAARAIPDLVGLPTEGIAGTAVKALSAIVVGIAVDMIGAPKRFGEFATAGALMGPIEDFASTLPLPAVISNALSAYPSGLGSYVQIPSGRSLSALPAGLEDGAYHIGSAGSAMGFSGVN
jgi:hypothetical protein